jgi:hypothetical protein
VVLISKLSADKLLVVFTKLIPPFSIAAFPLQKTLSNFTSKSNFMKRLNLIISIILSATIFFTACSKSSDNSTAKTKTQLITQSSWKFDNAKVSGIDVSGALQTCQKDNIYVFASTNTGTLDEGAARCNQSDPQTIPFNWNFTNNEGTLHISTVLFSGGGNDFAIESLTEIQLVLSQDITVSGTMQHAVVTFKH